MKAMRWKEHGEELRRIFRCGDDMWRAAALTRAHHLHPHYHAGVGSDHEGWRSVVSGDPCPDPDLDKLTDQMPTLGLARALWERKQGAFEAVRDKRLLAVADPIASLVTLAYHADAKTCSDEFLEECFHRFFRHTRPFECWLAQRPGLYIVIVGSDRALFRQLQTAFQNALRRMGEAAADLDVRWVQDDEASRVEGEADPAFKAILAGHPPTAPWEHANRPNDEWINGEIGTLEKHLHGLNAGAQHIYDVGRWLATFIHRSPAQKLSAAAVLNTTPQPVSLGAVRMAVRRFLPEPLTVTLAPVSLIASENASGKTTLVEGICNMYLGRPRVRLALPERAMSWRDKDDGPLPEIAALRICDGAGSELPERGALLCLFADDADLPSGETGETALTAWWSWGGDARDRLASGVTGLQERLEYLRREGAPQPTQATGSSAADPTKNWTPEGYVREVLIKSLRSEEDEQKERGSDESISPTEQKETAGARLKTIRQWRSQLEEGGGLLRNQFEELLPLLLDGLRRPEHLRALDEDGWRALAQADEALGGPSDLRKLAAELVVRAIEDAQRWLEGVNTDIEEHLINDGVRRLERRLYAFLDTALEHLPPEKVRPNTARQVQLAQAARLARSLSIGGADLPAIVVDEPTLGLDPPSAARAMARYLRLRRAAESMRWARFVTNDEAHAPALVRDGWTEAAKTEPEALLLLPPLEGADAFRRGPRSPQVILVSYQTPALMAVADVEGTVCDAPLRANLRKLIPSEWRLDVARELQAVSDAFRQEAAKHTAWCVRPPAEFARVYWRLDPASLPPIEGPEGYVKEAASSLERLGLFGARADIEHLCMKVEKLTKDKEKHEAQKKGGYEAAEKARDEIAKLSVDARRSAVRIATRLLRWMLLTDLLPAALADGERAFVISGVSVRMFPAAGGEAKEFGSARLRRIAPFRECLPEDLDEVVSPPAKPGAPAPQTPVLESTVPVAEAPPRGPALGDVGDVTAMRDGVALDISSTEVTRATSSVWRVLLPTDDAKMLPLGSAIRRAGMLPAEQTPLGEVAVLAVKGELEDPDDQKYRWTIQRLVPVPGLARDDTFPGSVDALSMRLIDWRYASLRETAREGEPIGIALSTYIADQIPADVAFLLGAQEPKHTGDESAWRNIWREALASQIEAPLLLIQQRLATSPQTHRVRLYPRCPAGAAIRAGAVFHHTTAFSVECDQNREVWNIDRPVDGRESAKLSREVQRAQGSDGTHLLLSITRPVRKEYEDWRQSRFGLEPTVRLELQPAAGPDRDAVSKTDVVAWAKDVSRAVLEVPESMRRLRIFCAAPNALAVALGRELNAFGEIVTMDWSKDAGVYVETFVFRGR